MISYILIIVIGTIAVLGVVASASSDTSRRQFVRAAVAHAIGSAKEPISVDQIRISVIESGRTVFRTHRNGEGWRQPDKAEVMQALVDLELNGLGRSTWDLTG